MTLTPRTIEELKRMAGIIRCDIIEMICTAGAGHPVEAIFPNQSATSRYRLVAMDRDGSNRHALFPGEGQIGLEVQKPLWSPAPGAGGDDYIAVMYQGNLWLIEGVSGAAQQVTGDGLILRMDWK